MNLDYTNHLTSQQDLKKKKIGNYYIYIYI